MTAITVCPFCSQDMVTPGYLELHIRKQHTPPMTPADWATVFRAGWNSDALHASDFTGNALAGVLSAMEDRLWEIHRRRFGPEETREFRRMAEEEIDG